MDGDNDIFKALQNHKKCIEELNNRLFEAESHLVRLNHDMEGLENKLKTRFPGF